MKQFSMPVLEIIQLEIRDVITYSANDEAQWILNDDAEGY